MRKNRIVAVVLLVFVLALSFAFAACTTDGHTCTSKCPTCGKCTNKDCTQEACKDKCPGHDGHVCQHVCATCGGCYDETCTDAACATKCDCVSGLENAKEYLRSLYIDAKYEATSANYDVVDHVRVKEPHSGVMTDYVVTWTITIDPGTTAPATVAKGEGKWTVTVSTEKFATNQEYKLVGTVTDAEGNTLSVTFNRYVPAYKVYSYDEFVKAADDADVAVQGIVTGIISKTNGNTSNGLYLQSLDNKGGFYIYNMAKDPVTEKITLGMKVEAAGKKDTYNGTMEVVSATVTVLDETPATVTPVDLTEAFKAASDLKATTLTYGQALLVKLTGVTILPQDDETTSSGYYKFQLAGKTAYVRISSSACPLVKADQTTMINNHKTKTGYTADVVGLVTLYSGSFYLTPVSADAFSNFNLPELSGQDAIDAEKEYTTLDEEILEDKVIDLPTTGSVYSKVTISWAFKTGETYNTATLDNNKLTIKLADDAETITLVATFTEGSVTDTKEYTIKIASKVIVWNDAATIIAECKKLNGDDKEKSEGWYYVYGTIIDDPTAEYCNFNLSDGTDNIVVYGLYTTDGTKRYGSKREIAELPVKKGDVVYLYAQLQNFGGTYELINARLQPAPEAGSNVVCPLTVAQAAEICNALESAGTDSEKKYYIIGTVGEIYNTEYCNFYLEDGSEVNLTVYGLWANATERYGSKRQIATFPFKQGDTMVIYGNLQKFVKGETTTLEITNGLLISYVTPSAGATDQEKVDAAKKEIKDITISKVGDTELYTSTDVTVTWKLKDETTAATLAGNKLTVEALPTEEDVAITLVATIKSGEVEETVEVTVTIKKAVTTVNDGTAEKPYTVEEVVAVTANLEKDEYTENMIYVKGIVKSFEKGSYVKNLYLVDTTDSTVSFLVFSANFTDTVTEIAVGDTIVVYGAVKNYNGTIEMTNVKVNNETVHGFPSLISCTAGQGTISIAEGSSEQATVIIENDQKTGENYTTFVFTVTVADGYELVSVKVDGVELTIENGKYTGRIAGNTVILVETKVAGQADPVVVGSLTFPATKQDSASSYTATWKASNDYSEWSIANFNNNQNKWSSIKCGREKYASVASIVNTVALTDAITKVSVNFKSISKVNSVKLVVASDAACTEIIETIDGSTTQTGDQIFSISKPAANLYYKLIIDCAITGKNGNIEITKLDYYAVK